jgi:phosphotransferase system HPr-like phosphotransfer protein
MQTAYVLLNSIDKVKGFVNTVSRFDSDFDMLSGHYIVDGKSIMGIFSLDLARPIKVLVYNDGEFPAIREALSDYLVPAE